MGRLPLGFDDLKEHEGRTYTGMMVGGRHSWLYTDAVWRERKVGPDEWDFTFLSTKRRERESPDGSGAPTGTEYHWYLLAHQFVRKIDKDSYATFMSGVKHKVAHRRPHWNRWSSEYPDRPSDEDRIREILEVALAALRGDRANGRSARPMAEQGDFVAASDLQP